MSDRRTAAAGRSAQLLGSVRDRSRATLRDRLSDLNRRKLALAQVALAVGVAWFVAREVFGHEQPFFAPAAAVLTLGLTFGARLRRAVEVGAGVALGIGVADLLVAGLGIGAWQLVVVVLLAMVAAMLAGGGPLLVNQAAISAVLVMTLQPPGSGLSGSRFVDAVIGAAVALLANAVVPTNPLRLVRREADPLLAELGAVLDDVADAIDASDSRATVAALQRARRLDPGVERVRDAIAVGRETAALAPPRRRARSQLGVFSTAVDGIDLAVRNTRVLARAAVRSLEVGERIPPDAVLGIHDLARAVRGLGGYLSDPDAGDEARGAALSAAAIATRALEQTGNLSANVIVGQVRATAVDLLSSMGMADLPAKAAVREARGELE